MNKVRINNKKGLLRKEFLAILFIVGLYVSCISIFDQDQMSLILPTLCLVSIMLYLTFKLMRIENRIPIFDAGYFMIGITFLYMFYPYISFMLSGFDWSITSDSRLKGAGADSKSLGSFAWYHVSYLLALTAGYLFFRPTSPV